MLFCRYPPGMARPLRIEYPGAFYHVINRGQRQEAICEDDKDRERFLSCLEKVSSLFGVRPHAYCLMTNHNHLVVETPEANLRVPNKMNHRTENERFCGWQGRRSRLSEDSPWSLTPSRLRISRLNAESPRYGLLVSNLLLNHLAIFKYDQWCIGLFGNLTCSLGRSFHGSINSCHVDAITFLTLRCHP